MAKSKAKKLREKLAREGKVNPEIKRSPFVFADMRTRTTKTKREQIYQFKHKNHQSQDGSDGSFHLSDISFSNVLLFTYNSWASSSDICENFTTVPGTAWAKVGISTDMTVPILA
jgi:hypothetical protein